MIRPFVFFFAEERAGAVVSAVFRASYSYSSYTWDLTENCFCSSPVKGWGGVGCMGGEDDCVTNIKR